MSEPQHQVDSVKTYAIVWVVLLIATLVTTEVSFIDLGSLNVVVALTIAVCKMLLVALFFMHVRHSTKLTKVVIVSGLVWLFILISLTLTDFFTRSWVS